MSIQLDELIEEELKANRHIDESKTKAEQIVAKAKTKAQELIDQASKTENITTILKTEEETANIEADKILKDYRKQISKYRKIPDEAFNKAVDLAVKEVLKFE